MFLLIDVGGTKTRVSVSVDGETIHKPIIFPTASKFSDSILHITDAARRLARGKSIRAAVMGVPGPVGRSKKLLLQSPNLPEWVGVPLGEKIETALGVRVYLENDTALVGLGEASVRGGSEKEIIAYVGIGTGVGGVRILNGAIDEYAVGFEIGHQIISMDETVRCSCGGSGHLEAYISGRAFEKRFGKHPSFVTDLGVWRDAAGILAIGLNNAIVHWSPERIIIGGSMMKKVGIPLEDVRTQLNGIVKIQPEIPILEQGILGDEGGLKGGLEYCRRVTNLAA